MAVYEIKPNPEFSTRFMLYVLPTVSEMRKEAKRLIRKIGKNPDVTETVSGLFVPAPIYVNKKQIGDFTGEMFGYMFLSEEFLNPQIIPHECLHAAMEYERHCMWFSMNYHDDDDDKNEERLAYYLGDCTHAVWKVLVENRHVRTLKGFTKWLRH